MTMNNNKSASEAFWKANVKLMLKLLVVWFVVSFGFGIILVDVLNEFSLGGYKLGFWFAQQGSIYTFVVLIFLYANRITKLEKEHGLDQDH
jgi:putative solute:sodium symporter small subunit